jgi:hypothetical protein
MPYRIVLDSCWINELGTPGDPDAFYRLFIVLFSMPADIGAPVSSHEKGFADLTS